MWKKNFYSKAFLLTYTADSSVLYTLSDAFVHYSTQFMYSMRYLLRKNPRITKCKQLMKVIAAQAEMEFLDGIFGRGSGHKLDTQTRVLSTLIFLFYKMLFMNRLEFSCFADFFVRIKPEKAFVNLMS
jgi:hypothetical protein